MTGCYVSRKKVPIPSALIGLAKEDEVQSQFHAHYDLVNRTTLKVEADGRMISEDTLRRARQGIVKSFLTPLKGYGSVVLRTNKEKLVEAVEKLKKDMGSFQKGIKEELQKNMDRNAEALVNALLPAVSENPPEWYTKHHGPSISPEEIKRLLEADIKDAFGKAEDLIEDMKISLVSKDLAYESLVDKNFLRVAREAMPTVKILHDEYEAARALSTGVAAK